MLWILRLVAEAGTMLDKDDGLEYQLPKHHRCDFHLLNLVPTVNVSEANAYPIYKRLSFRIFKVRKECSRPAIPVCHSLKFHSIILYTPLDLT